MTPEEETQIMTPEEAAKWLKLGDLGHENPVQTVLRLREDGKITRRLVAGRVAFTLSDLREYVRGTVTDRHARVLDGPKRRQRRTRNQDVRPPEHDHQSTGNGGISSVATEQPKPLRLIPYGG